MTCQFLLVDIVAWWLTKLNSNFTWLPMIAEVVMALAFSFMWIVYMYEMWILPRIKPDMCNAILDE